MMNSRLHLLALACLLFRLPCGVAAEPAPPRLADDRLTIELFSIEPDVVTPFGITVDAAGRVYVVESHTHMRPEGYDGPAHDRLRLLVDTDLDGSCDHVGTFYEGEKWLMNVAAHPNGWIYAVSRNELFRLADSDGDGRADQRETLAKMETSGDYPHNGFLSLTFDFSGAVYFGMGQNYGASFALRGSDGVTVSSRRGDGGIFRCAPDGSQLSRMALGFWNPCGLGFDAFGRLFTVDNDPGNRPPCRFIEVVAGGDFGYRRHALEPFISWNGELPGTLPMLASTPEAPTAVLAYESDLLPPEYRGELLVSSWSEYRIDRFRTEVSGASFAVTSQPLLVGDGEFRPSGIAVAPDGSLLVSDWVDRSYPVHGRGRVWRIRTAVGAGSRPAAGDAASAAEAEDRAVREAGVRRLLEQGQAGAEVLQQQFLESPSTRAQAASLAGLVLAGEVEIATAQAALSHPVEAIREQAVRTLPADVCDWSEILRQDPSHRVQAAALRRITDPGLREQVIAAIHSDDRLLRQAAGVALGRVCTLEELQDLLGHANELVRHAALLAIRDGHPSDFESVLIRALDDPSEQMRYSATEWIAEHERTSYRQRLIDDLAIRPMSFPLFEASLAAVAAVDGLMRQWRPGRNGDWWKSRSAAYEIAAGLLALPNAPKTTIQRAIEFLPPEHVALSVDRLEQVLAQSGERLELQLALVRAMQAQPGTGDRLAEIASDERYGVGVRAEAAAGLDPSDRSTRQLLIRLASTGPAPLRQEALRSLRGAQLDVDETRRLRQLAGESAEFAQLVARVLEPSLPPPRPALTDSDSWLERIGGDADPRAGSRVFFHPRGPGCGKCHRIDGRGELVGPSFHRTPGSRSFSRRQLLEAILQPSREIALGYVPFHFVMADGRVQIGIPKTEDDDEYQIFDDQGALHRVKRSEIDEMAPSTTSIMPDGLVSQMTDGELRDVIAYLMGSAP